MRNRRIRSTEPDIEHEEWEDELRRAAGPLDEDDIEGETRLDLVSMMEISSARFAQGLNLDRE